jgi:hypothetical protein
LDRRIDAEVDAMARKVQEDPPAYAWLHPAQRRTVQVLIEHMRSLPDPSPGESGFDKPEYSIVVNALLTRLFRVKYPDWKA